MEAKEIWSREKALRMLDEIATAATGDAVDESGEVKAQVAKAAISAIDQANRMCGYHEPEKVEVDQRIEVTLEGELKGYAK
jgi:hypothetical protein